MFREEWNLREMIALVCVQQDRINDLAEPRKIECRPVVLPPDAGRRAGRRQR
jgi:hypothetical protein